MKLVILSLACISVLTLIGLLPVRSDASGCCVEGDYLSCDSADCEIHLTGEGNGSHRTWVADLPCSGGGKIVVLVTVSHCTYTVPTTCAHSPPKYGCKQIWCVDCGSISGVSDHCVGDPQTPASGGFNIQEKLYCCGIGEVPYNVFCSYP